MFRQIRRKLRTVDDFRSYRTSIINRTKKEKVKVGWWAGPKGPSLPGLSPVGDGEQKPWSVAPPRTVIILNIVFEQLILLLSHLGIETEF